MKNFFIFLLIFLKLKFSSAGVVPATSPTRHQFVAGIGIPLQLKNEAITLGYTMKAQYYLADNVNQLKFQFFPDIWAPNEPNFLWDQVWHRWPDGRRRRRDVLIDSMTNQTYESFDVNVDQIGDEPLKDETKGANWESMSENDEDGEFDDAFDDDLQDMEMNQNADQGDIEQIMDHDDESFDLPRWTIYDGIGKFLSLKGFAGRECVLRSICEASETPFGDNLYEEMSHIFFTPSTTNEKMINPSDFDYIEAERHGKDWESGKKCSEIYSKCEKSLMEIISDVEDKKFYGFK